MFKKIIEIADKVSSWFNQIDRVHDMLRLGMGLTVMYVFSQFGFFWWGFSLWTLIVMIAEVRHMKKHGKAKNYLYKDTLYDLAWAYSGVALFCIFLGGLFTFISASMLTLWVLAIIYWYDSEKRYDRNKWK